MKLKIVKFIACMRRLVAVVFPGYLSIRCLSGMHIDFVMLGEKLRVSVFSCEIVHCELFFILFLVTI